MALKEAIITKIVTRIPQTHAYSSTLFPETTYAPQGIEFRTRLHVRGTMTDTQRAEVDRLYAAGVRHEGEKGHHLSLINPTLAYSGDGRPIISADAAEGNYVTSRALVRPSAFRRSERQAPIEAKTVGAGIVVVTADGKFIGVTRSGKNGNYSGFREVSASGGITIRDIHPGKGLNDAIEETMREEVHQEMKVSAEEAATMKMTPIVLVKDERLPHYGVGFIGYSTRTSDEIMQGQYAIAEHDNSAYDFSESLHVVDGTRDAVRAYILNDTQPPLTGSAREMWLAAGARHIFEMEKENGRSVPEARQIAENWRKQVRKEADRLYRRLDAQVRRYYRANPHAIAETERADKPQRYWVGGIDPARHPEGQGIRGDTLYRRRSQSSAPTIAETSTATAV